VTILIVGAATMLIWQRQLVADTVRSLTYQPTTAVEQLTTRLELTTIGKIYFYASTPVFDTTSAASEKCGTREESSAILGCYANGTIYVYDIDNSELKGVEEVTAAHELLHAAYARLSRREVVQLQNLMGNEVARLRSDSAFTERMKVYDELDKESYYSELYAVLGTEFTELSGELEGHFARYLRDRNMIVALHKGYEGVFKDLQAKADSLVAEYDTLMTTRNTLIETINSDYATLQQEIDTLPDTATQAQVDVVNQKINAYNAALVAAKEKIAAYDTKLQTLKEEIATLAVHQQELNKTIDSSLAPSPQL
jgi:hypothetical protein